MTADLATQIALRARLVASPEVTALVPADSILDTLGTPAPRPSIVIGEAQVLDTGDSLSRTRSRVIHTLHVWKADVSREGVKRIMFEARNAILFARLDLGPDHHCIDWNVPSLRAIADPDGQTAHGIMTVDLLVQEVS